MQKRTMLLLIGLAASSCVGTTILAQSPAPGKSKAELIRDIQSPPFDEAGPKAVEIATQEHDFEVLAAGLLAPWDHVKLLCLKSLDAFSDDQIRMAMTTSLLSDAAWAVSPGSYAGTTRFFLEIRFAEKLKRFGIVIQPIDLEDTSNRKAVAHRLMSGVNL